MLALAPEVIALRASKMPLSYMEEIKAAATIREDGCYCFDPAEFLRIRNKYRKYAVSQADPYRERISGCCDRADQY